MSSIKPCGGFGTFVEFDPRWAGVEPYPFPGEKGEEKFLPKCVHFHVAKSNGVFTGWQYFSGGTGSNEGNLVTCSAL